jgi:hypothetical protein
MAEGITAAPKADATKADATKGDAP